MKTPSWDQIRSFHAVMEHQSLSEAARHLGCTQPTVGRHISELETALGTSLFVRSHQGLTPTNAASDLSSHASAMATASAALVRSARGQRSGQKDGLEGPEGAEDIISGTVRLTTSDIVGCEVLPHILEEFRKRWPEIHIELALTNTNQDLSRREADLAIRMVRPVQKSLRAHRIGNVSVRLYARKDYLEKNGTPQSFDDLRDGHTLIGYDANLALLNLMAARGIDVARDDFAIRTDNEIAQHAMLRAGLGISGMQAHLARRSPDLVLVLPDEIPIPMDMWVVAHEDLYQTKPVRLLYDYLVEALTAFIAPGSEDETP